MQGIAFGRPAKDQTCRPVMVAGVSLVDLDGGDRFLDLLTGDGPGDPLLRSADGAQVVSPGMTRVAKNSISRRKSSTVLTAKRMPVIWVAPASW